MLYNVAHFACSCMSFQIYDVQETTCNAREEEGESWKNKGEKVLTCVRVRVCACACVCVLVYVCIYVCL